jgi:hypothetical protein
MRWGISCVTAFALLGGSAEASDSMLSARSNATISSERRLYDEDIYSRL